MSEFDIDVEYVPVCSVCWEPVHLLDDDKTWAHSRPSTSEGERA